jgi:tRNA pseudouridine38-40 synthase
MNRYFLELAYDGTRYSGYQIQDGQHTIQSELTRALETLFRQPMVLTGSSRTDAGVHALQNFFHVDTESTFTARHQYNLNAILPHDIALKGIYAVPATAHCRFDAVHRSYRYQLYHRKDPFMVNRGWLYPYPVNRSILEHLASMVMDYADFTSFSKRNTQVKTYICRVTESAWRETEVGLVYEVRSNRFLRGMIRGLVGTMLRIARTAGTLEEAKVEFDRILRALDCREADFTTPARGLFLTEVGYPEGLLSDRIV